MCGGIQSGGLEEDSLENLGVTDAELEAAAEDVTLYARDLLSDMLLGGDANNGDDDEDDEDDEESVMQYLPDTGALLTFLVDRFLSLVDDADADADEDEDEEEGSASAVSAAAAAAAISKAKGKGAKGKVDAAALAAAAAKKQQDKEKMIKLAASLASLSIGSGAGAASSAAASTSLALEDHAGKLCALCDRFCTLLPHWSRELVNADLEWEPLLSLARFAALRADPVAVAGVAKLAVAFMDVSGECTIGDAGAFVNPSRPAANAGANMVRALFSSKAVHDRAAAVAAATAGKTIEGRWLPAVAQSSFERLVQRRSAVAEGSRASFACVFAHCVLLEPWTSLEAATDALASAGLEEESPSDLFAADDDVDEGDDVFELEERDESGVLSILCRCLSEAIATEDAATESRAAVATLLLAGKWVLDLAGAAGKGKGKATSAGGAASGALSKWKHASKGVDSSLVDNLKEEIQGVLEAATEEEGAGADQEEEEDDENDDEDDEDDDEDEDEDDDDEDDGDDEDDDDDGDDDDDDEDDEDDEDEDDAPARSGSRWEDPGVCFEYDAAPMGCYDFDEVVKRVS